MKLSICLPTLLLSVAVGAQATPAFRNLSRDTNKGKPSKKSMHGELQSNEEQPQGRFNTEAFSTKDNRNKRSENGQERTRHSQKKIRNRRNTFN